MEPCKLFPIDKLISGGQTGADRAALDWAIDHDLPHGGWCPKGRLAEDGEIDLRYKLEETPSADYEQRTEWNVRDSDGTVIFTLKPELTGGSEFTRQMAFKHEKPLLHLCQNDVCNYTQRLMTWVQENSIAILNVAGTRISEEPTICDFVNSVLDNQWIK